MHLFRRRFWFITTSRRIEFDWVGRVLYGYADMGFGLMAHRAQDLFTVALQLKDGKEVTLFRFYGEGEFINNSFLPDWMYWEENMMTPIVQGGQEGESKVFVDVLSGLIGVPVGNFL